MNILIVPSTEIGAARWLGHAEGDSGLAGPERERRRLVHVADSPKLLPEKLAALLYIDGVISCPTVTREFTVVFCRVSGKQDLVPS